MESDTTSDNKQLLLSNCSVTIGEFYYISDTFYKNSSENYKNNVSGIIAYVLNDSFGFNAQYKSPLSVNRIKINDIFLILYIEKYQRKRLPPDLFLFDNQLYQCDIFLNSEYYRIFIDPSYLERVSDNL